MIKTLSAFSSLLILLAAILTGCSEQEQTILPSGNSIAIGVIGPMEGVDKEMGIHGLEGIKTALHLQPYLNNGDKIRLVIEDDKNQPELAVRLFRKLVNEEQAEAVIVLSGSASALAINDIADRYKTPVLVLLATHPDISTNNQFVSQLCFDNTLQGKVAALYVRDELLIERVAVFKDPDSQYSGSLANEFIQKFQSMDGQIDELVLSRSLSGNYQKILRRLRSEGVQMLYLPVTADSVLKIAATLEALNWHPEVMVGDNLLNSAFATRPEVIRQLNGFLSIDMYSATLPPTNEGKKARKAFHELFNTRESSYPASGYEGMSILLKAMNHCLDSKEVHCLNTTIQNTTDFPGLMGNITILPTGKSLRPLIVNRIQGNRLEFMVKVY